MVMLGGDVTFAADINGFVPQLLDVDEVTADSSTWAGTESAALYTVTADLVSGERYLLRLFTNVSTSSSAASPGIEFSQMRFREDTSAGTQFVSANAYCPTTSGNGFPVSMTGFYTAAATGAKTFVVTGQRSSGAGNHQIRASGSRKTYFELWYAPA